MTIPRCLSVLVVCAVCLVACTAQLKLPENTPVQEERWLEQGWSDDERAWFHHTSQGTATLPLPYDWLLALEQPHLGPREQPLLREQGYLGRFGFIPDAKSGYNPDGLPVGFARDPHFVDPLRGEPYDAVGFTCAACHTGQLEFAGESVRIDGGAAVTALDRFTIGLGLSMLHTQLVPARFRRFADRVLGPARSRGQKRALKAELKRHIAALKRLAKWEKNIADHSVTEGYARLDALTRIGNQLFGVMLNNAGNYVPRKAPVKYPHLWGAPWFSWVQYNGSIEQPMFRNTGEALGVAAFINLQENELPLYGTTVRMFNLFDMEQLIAGPQPNVQTGFAGLRAPVWPEDVFGPIDRRLAARGAELYQQHCQHCHLPAPDTQAFWSDEHWLPANAAGERYLDLPMIDIALVGTDPAQAKVMAAKDVEIPAYLGETDGSYGQALQVIVNKTMENWYDRHAIPAAERERMNGYRDPGVRAPMQYKARPLDGIWATPPYLHNGSVANLYELLSPRAERTQLFQLGNRQYDPVMVGYVKQRLVDGFVLDTRIPGNLNTGHEFVDGERGGGVIGPALTVYDRWALVEYLKTITSGPPPEPAQPVDTPYSETPGTVPPAEDAGAPEAPVVVE